MGIVSESDSSSVMSSTTITDDEAALYDRQLRLWGIDAQKRLREAKVLIIGLGGLGAEIAKNIALAGVNSITLLDDKNVGPADRFCQFLVAEAKEGENRAVASQPGVKRLNPNVEVISDSSSAQEKQASFFLQFSVICATNCPLDFLIKLNNICRDKKIMFFCGDVWGFFGYCFIDLLSYTFLNKPSNDKMAKGEPQLETIEFVSLEKAMSVKRGKLGTGLNKRISKAFFLVHMLNKFYETQSRLPSIHHRAADIEVLKSIRSEVIPSLGFEVEKLNDEDLDLVFGEISPVCAIVGGIFSQEVIKAVGAVEMPFKNFFLFNGNENTGTIENIG